MPGDQPDTRFVRPPQQLLDKVVTCALQSAGARGAHTNGYWIESGTSVLVFVHQDTVVRVARQRSSSAGLRRTQSLVDALPPLPFDVARSVGSAVDVDGHAAIPVMRLRGEHLSHGVRPPQLRALLDAIHAIDPQPIRRYLAQRRSFIGGPAWESVLRQQVLPLLHESGRQRARERIGALADLPAVPLSVNHGDLTRRNLLWVDGRVSGVLDWDLTALEDPAEDAATLASSYGWSVLRHITDAATAERASVFRRSFPLQLVAFALVNRRPSDEVARAVAYADSRLRADDPS